MKCNKLISCYFGNKVVFVIVFHFKKKEQIFIGCPFQKKKIGNTIYI